VRSALTVEIAAPHARRDITMKPRSLGAAALALALSSIAPDAGASTSADLTSLVTRLQSLDASLTVVAFSPPETCLDVGSLSNSVRDYVAAAEQVYARLSSPTHPTVADLDNLAQLGALSLDMAAKARLLSAQLQGVGGLYDLFEIRSGLSAMLQLSRDIGTMADRILEMGDRILAMADNIGTMADRILTTQRIQSANVAATQAALLTTQQNMVSLTASVSTIGYNVTLGLVKSDGFGLSQQMGGLTLTAGNMGAQLGALAAVADAATSRAVSLHDQVSRASQGASHYVNGDTLTILADLAPIHASLAASLDAAAHAVQALAPYTDSTVLGDATRALLTLIVDVGAMSDRIMEMNDKIIVMADNIGVMAGRIIETQNIQKTNILLTQASLRSAQSVMLSVIQTWGL
jgi:hypothetical protein